MGARTSSPGREYEEHRAAVLAMLAKRFPRFDEEERLGLYHEAWVRALAKRGRGESIDSLRAYLLATAGAEAMNAATRRRPPLPLGPEDPLLGGLADDRPGVEDEVVVRDQARLARELIDSLDERQRAVLKLRWDVGMSPSEVRAALGLSPRQYQRLAEEGAIAIAERVGELEDGTWSRQQRSLLAACLVQVTCEGEVRDGIATPAQRRRAQRLVESDPHVAALYAEMRAATRRAAALLPLPALVAADSSLAAPLGEVVAALRERAADAFASVKHTTISLYVRAADPSLLTGPRPGAAAIAAGALAVGTGVYGAAEHLDPKRPVPARAPLVQPLSTAPSAVARPALAVVEEQGSKPDRRRRGTGRSAAEAPVVAESKLYIPSSDVPGESVPTQPEVSEGAAGQEFGIEQ